MSVASIAKLLFFCMFYFSIEDKVLLHSPWHSLGMVLGSPSWPQTHSFLPASGFLCCLPAWLIFSFRLPSACSSQCVCSSQTHPSPPAVLGGPLKSGKCCLRRSARWTCGSLSYQVPGTELPSQEASHKRFRPQSYHYPFSFSGIMWLCPAVFPTGKPL